MSPRLFVSHLIVYAAAHTALMFSSELSLFYMFTWQLSCEIISPITSYVSFSPDSPLNYCFWKLGLSGVFPASYVVLADQVTAFSIIARLFLLSSFSFFVIVIFLYFVLFVHLFTLFLL